MRSRLSLRSKAEDFRVPARPGQRVRVRVSDTDNGPMKVWSSGPYRLLAVDGTDVHRPTEVSDQSVSLPAGGRADLEVQVPMRPEPVEGARSGCSCPKQPQ